MRINVHFLTHLSQCVLNWGCLWSYSTFIPEWLNGELLTLKHVSQSVAAQIVINYLFKMAGRDEIVGFEKDGQVFPPDVREFFHESFHLPASFDESSILITGTKIRWLGCPKTRKLNLDEEIALMNYLKMDPEEIDRLTVQSYPRLEMQSTKSILAKIFAPCLPMKCFSLLSQQLLVLGREMGVESKTNYVPAPIGNTTFHIFQAKL